MLPVVSPAVPEGLARLRATVTAAHETEEIARAMDVIAENGEKTGNNLGLQCDILVKAPLSGRFLVFVGSSDSFW